MQRLLRILALLMNLLYASYAFAGHPTATTPPDTALLVVSYHDVRDNVALQGDPDAYAVSTSNFIAHLDWFKGNGYHPVSLQQVADAAQGKSTLPSKAVLLTFDDGLRSLYTHVFPLLRAYGYPAVAAIVTSWVDMPSGRTVDYGPRPFTRDDFVTWDQLREMQASGLVELASHANAMHLGLRANPQGNMTPAAITRIYDATTARYETEAAYRARIEADLRSSRDTLAAQLGRAPRALVWPYAANSDVANAIATDLGMPITFDLDGRNATLRRDLHGLARLLVMGNPSVTDLGYELRRPLDAATMRAVQVDLDMIYDADPKQQQRNLDALIERIARLKPSHVFLQAFADPDGNGSADALYFPNRHLPMRADLYSHVAWQLRTRAGVVVYAWLPVLGFELPDRARSRRLAIRNEDPADNHRLDPTNPEARQVIREIYADLGTAGYFEGLLFHDDALLRRTELPRLVGTRNRTDALIDFTMGLKAAAQQWRPKLKTVRNLFASPVLEPESEAWFAQDLASFNRTYDFTAVMAMPWMEGHGRQATAWMERLASRVERVDPGFHKTLFELQTVDWRTQSPIPGRVLKQQARMLVARGVRHLAWYPDDPIANQPRLEDAREALSARNFPYEKK